MALDAKSGHFYKVGERVEIGIVGLRQFHFDTAYGTMYVQIFETQDGKIVKYKGGAPLDVDFGNGAEWVKVKATIKHSSYNGVNETFIQRVKEVPVCVK